MMRNRKATAKPSLTIRKPAPARRADPMKRLVEVGLRLGAARTVKAVHGLLIAEAARLCGAQRVLLALETKGALQIADARLPQGEDPQVLLAAITPWIAEARQTRNPRLRHGPEGAAPADQRSCLIAPLIAHRRLLGYLYADVEGHLGRLDDAHLGLLAMLAAQGGAALDNLQRVDALEQETREAQERQTATAEILSVISRFPNDVQPALDAIVESTRQLVPLANASLFLREGRSYRRAATVGPAAVLPAGTDTALTAIDATANFPSQVIESGKPLHLPDWTTIDLPPQEQTIFERNGIRMASMLPLMRNGECIGVLSAWRTTPGALSTREIALLQSFAGHAVIAIENVRLFNETKEALEQQAATNEVLREISRSTFDLDRILQSLLNSAMNLSQATTSALFLPGRDDTYRLAVLAGYGADSALEKALRATPIGLDHGTTTGRTLLTRRTVHVHDISVEPGYRQDLVLVAAYRTNLAVPLLRDGEIVGVITLTRGGSVAPFTAKQIELVETFAAQAVIAMENVRLFNETRKALEQQTATAEVLQVISNSVADTQPVFEKILESCQRVIACTDLSVLTVDDDSLVHIGAVRGAGGLKVAENYVPQPVERTVIGEALQLRRVMHYPDALNGADVT